MSRWFYLGLTVLTAISAYVQTSFEMKAIWMIIFAYSFVRTFEKRT